MATLSAAVLAASAALAFGSSGGAGSKQRVALCGAERWAVKTLQDRPHLVPVHPASIAYLVTRAAPLDLPATRLAFERQIFRVHARVELVRSEADGDLHVVLSDGQRTMIAEAPSASCDGGAAAAWRRQMSRARAAVRDCSGATVTGVAFFDYHHGQTGVAPNAIELHPILGFRCSSSARDLRRPSSGPAPLRRGGRRHRPRELGGGLPEEEEILVRVAPRPLGHLLDEL
jgi:hypothetical protein